MPPHDPVDIAIAQLSRFPGIGERTAQRMIFWLMQQDSDVAENIGTALCNLPELVQRCQRCGTITTSTLCAICEDSNRQEPVICVVERPQDIEKIEQTGRFNGTYHVLGGSLSPLQGISADQLRIRELLLRLREEPATEILIAVDPDAEGDATAYYLADLIKPLNIRVSRIAHGVAVGTEIGYASNSSLRMAIENRQLL